MERGKLIIVTAPSGAGKTTVVKHLLQDISSLAFSVSATTRPKREKETDGIDYYFLSAEAFKQKVAQGDFVEWEEVYPGKFYGTLHSELTRLWEAGKHIIFDVDVKGAVNLEQHYPENTLSLFIKPPSVDVLIERLRNRNTETPEMLETRLQRVRLELTYEKKFDVVIVNDKLDTTVKQAYDAVMAFISKA